MQELEVRIGVLRLLVADVSAKQRHLGDIEAQYRDQLSRVVDFVVYREGNVDNALSLMSEIEGKLNEVLQTIVHLDMIDMRARAELEVLELTKRVAGARSQLVELEERRSELSVRLSTLVGNSEAGRAPEWSPGDVDPIRTITEEVQAVAVEIDRLNSLISEASEMAVQTVQIQVKTPRPGIEGR